MASIITLNTIEKAISNLNYRNEKSHKYKLIHAINAFYADEDSVRKIEVIPSESLIRSLWNTGNDPIIINKRQRNLSSIRSSVNSDLKKLYDKGKNPEGITISPTYTFVMSDEAKDQAFKSFIEKIPGKGSVDLDEITKILSVVDEILADPQAIQSEDSSDRLQKLDELKNSIQSLTRRIGIEESGESGRGNIELVDAPLEIDSEDELEEITEDEDMEELEVLDELEEITEDEDMEELEVLDELEEIAEDEDVEDLEVPDELDEVAKDEDVEDLEVPDELDEVARDEDVEELEVPDELDGVAKDKDVEGLEVPDELDEVARDEDVEDLEVPDELDEVAKDEDVEDLEVPDELDEVAKDEDVEELEVPDELDEVAESDDIMEELLIDDGELGDLINDDNGVSELSDSTSEAEPGAVAAEMPFDYDGSSEGSNDPKTARLLAEQFNHSLAAMDKFYNQYILIPEGDYLVGSRQPNRNERSEKTVQLSSFYIGKYPVTNALFEIFVEKTGYKTTAEKLGVGTVYHGRYQKRVDTQTGQETMVWNATMMTKTVEGAFWYQPFGPGSTIHKKRNHPVVQVSLEDAMAFAAWSGKRLPTEDEWEAAARTASGNVFPWGNEWQKEGCNMEESGLGDTTPVDSYLTYGNDFGIIDTLGNVFEWAASVVPYSLGNSKTTFNIIKGGSWVSASDIRLDTRSQLEPESHSNRLGFRCVAF